MKDRPIKRAHELGVRFRITESAAVFQNEGVHASGALEFISKDPSVYLSDDFQRGAAGKYGPVEPLRDLQVTCLFQGAESVDEHSLDWTIPYGLSLAYYRTYKVDLDLSERMTATLRRIHRALEVMDRVAGPPSSFGSWCQRIAVIVGASAYYDGRGDYWSNLGGLQAHVDGQIAQWKREHAATLAGETVSAS